MAKWKTIDLKAKAKSDYLEVRRTKHVKRWGNQQEYTRFAKKKESTLE
jgi:hypothetical protein